jgi:hypothetical protein
MVRDGDASSMKTLAPAMDAKNLNFIVESPF